MTVSVNTKQAEGLVDFIKSLGKEGPNISKKMAEIVLKSLGRTVDTTAIIVAAAASGNPKQAILSSPELITIYITGKGFYLG